MSKFKIIFTFISSSLQIMSKNLSLINVSMLILVPTLSFSIILNGYSNTRFMSFTEFNRMEYRLFSWLITSSISFLYLFQKLMKKLLSLFSSSLISLPFFPLLLLFESFLLLLLLFFSQKISCFEQCFSITLSFSF